MQTECKYTGATPGTDSTERTLFDTTVASPNARGLFQLTGTRRFMVDIAHDNAFTLKSYWSRDGGTTWNQDSSEAFAVPAAGVTRARDFLVEPYRDWKVTATNGGTAQGTWIVAMAMSDQRAAAL